MIVALVAIVVLIAVTVAVSYLNLRAANAQATAAQDMELAAQDLLDALVTAYDGSQQTRAAAARLEAHQAALDDMQEQNLATRKQMKGLMRHVARVAAQSERVLSKQYTQQQDVDDILYHVRSERERLERGELNG